MIDELKVGCFGMFVIGLLAYAIGREDGRKSCYQSVFDAGYRKGKNEVRLISNQQSTNPTTQPTRENLSELEK